jgi:ATP-binding cassette subfamily C protein CydD
MLAWARGAGWVLGGATLAGYGNGVLGIAQAWLLSGVVAGVFLGGDGLAQALPGLSGLLAVFLARAGLTWAHETGGAAGAARIKNLLRERLLAHLYRLGPAYSQGQATGELVATAVQGVEALDGFYSQYLPQVALAALIPITILAVVFPIDPLSGLVFFLTGPLIPQFMVLIGRSAEAVTRKQYTALGRMSAFFLDTLQGLATLKQLNQSQARIEQIAAVSERYRQKTMEVLRLTFLSALALELAATVSTAVVAVEVGLRLLYGQMAFQPAFFILILAPEFYLPLRLLGQRFHAGAAGAVGARRIRAVLEMEGAEPVETENEREGVDEQAPEIVKLVHVSFRYAGRVEAALDGVTLELHKGELVALAGESGAGKSTLAYMLLGFISPQNGSIRLDEKMTRSLDTPAWRRQVAWVPQRPYIFQDTLAANIRLGRPEASPADVTRAAQLAGLDGFIRSLPEGYETRAGALGARLSGGQAQRLALARAFLKDAPILILDEPTSRLDPELEEELAETTWRLCQGRMALVIAHRLASIRRADRVVVMEHGRIVEQGVPGVLIAQGVGSFARLVERAE